MTFLRRVFFLFLLSVINISQAKANKEDVVVCGNVEIRKSEELKKLENCTVVIGNVVIILGHVGKFILLPASQKMKNYLLMFSNKDPMKTSTLLNKLTIGLFH